MADVEDASERAHVEHLEKWGTVGRVYALFKDLAICLFKLPNRNLSHQWP